MCINHKGKYRQITVYILSSTGQAVWWPGNSKGQRAYWYDEVGTENNTRGRSWGIPSQRLMRLLEMKERAATLATDCSCCGCYVHMNILQVDYDKLILITMNYAHSKFIRQILKVNGLRPPPTSFTTPKVWSCSSKPNQLIEWIKSVNNVELEFEWWITKRFYRYLNVTILTY